MSQHPCITVQGIQWFWVRFNLLEYIRFIRFSFPPSPQRDGNIKGFWSSRAIQIHAIATFSSWLLDLASRAHCSLGDDMLSVFKCKICADFSFFKWITNLWRIQNFPIAKTPDNTHADNFAGMLFYQHPCRRGAFLSLVVEHGHKCQDILFTFLCCGPGSLNYTKF